MRIRLMNKLVASYAQNKGIHMYIHTFKISPVFGHICVEEEKNHFSSALLD